MRPGLPLGLLWVLVAVSVSCYETHELRIRLVAPAADMSCLATIDQVALEAGYARLSNVSGPPLFYAPKIAPTAASASALFWGIGVWMYPHGEHDENDRCTFELEALGEEAGCGMMCSLSYQRGAEFDEAVRDFARRLDVAFRAPARRSPG